MQVEQILFVMIIISYYLLLFEYLYINFRSMNSFNIRKYLNILISNFLAFMLRNYSQVLEHLYLHVFTTILYFPVLSFMTLSTMGGILSGGDYVLHSIAEASIFTI